VVCPPTMAGPESLVRGSLFRACRLAMVPPPLEAKSQNQTTSVAETLARTRSIQNSVTRILPCLLRGDAPSVGQGSVSAQSWYAPKTPTRHFFTC
jgi:hypothetical protein